MQGCLVDVSQRREITTQVYKNSGGFELALSPALLGLIGYLLDRWFGTVPVLTVIFVVVGLAGACVKLYYGYQREMDEHEANAPWAKRRD
jgi:F0F1-type ATP synthase assembly protein I